MGSFWDRTEVGPGSFWYRVWGDLGVDFVSIRDRCGIVMGSMCGRSEVSLHQFDVDFPIPILSRIVEGKNRGRCPSGRFLASSIQQWVRHIYVLNFVIEEVVNASKKHKNDVRARFTVAEAEANGCGSGGQATVAAIGIPTWYQVLGTKYLIPST